MFGTALSRVALLRNARSGGRGGEVTAHVTTVGLQLTVRYHNYVSTSHSHASCLCFTLSLYDISYIFFECRVVLLYRKGIEVSKLVFL